MCTKPIMPDLLKGFTNMKPAMPRILFKTTLLLVCLMKYSFMPAQDHKETKEANSQQITELNKTLLSDKQKQAELLSFYEQSFTGPLPQDDTISLYLADLDAIIDVSQKQHIPYPIKLMDDCRDLIRQDLKELTLNGVRSGLPFMKIAAINDDYLKEIFNAYKTRYRPGWKYGKTVPEFGRADYLKAIRTIFTSIVTLRVRSLTEDVNVVIYSMRNDKFVASSSGKTEFIKPLETGSYIVELSKPGYKKKLKKVVLGKYPKSITIQEALMP
jgi:hypothetical protein